MLAANTGMSEGAKNKPFIVIDGRVLPEQLAEQMIRDVVHGFYDEIRKDALLGPVFNGAIAPHDWARHLTKMCDFWSSLILRTGRYDGRPHDHAVLQAFRLAARSPVVIPEHTRSLHACRHRAGTPGFSP